MNIYESEEKEVKKDKQWLRNRYEQMETVKMTTKNSRESKSVSYIKKKTAINLLNQLDEPEVLSQEWIDRNKEPFHHFETKKVDYYVSTDFLQNLLVPKQEEVDQAYKDGYEIGKKHATEKERETVGSVFVDFLLASAKLKLVLAMEVEELEK